MSYTIREATQDERDRFVRSTWRRSFASPKKHRTALGQGEYFGLRGDGGAKIDQQYWLDAHAKIIDEELAHAHVVVADLGGECLGWAAWDDDQLHYVYVAPRFRRRGVGRALLLRAGACKGTFPPSHLTYEGELLLNAVLRQQPGATVASQHGQAAHDG